MAGRLKVYVTRIGFHELAVAAPNQKAALKAWDVEGDLFARGEAEAATDPDTIEHGLASPGVVLRRLPGGKTPWTAAEGELPDAPPPEPAISGKATPAKGRAAKAAKPKPPPSRKALDKAEAALDAARAELDALDARHAEEAKALKARQGKARAALRKTRDAAQAAVDKARKAWKAR